MAVYKVPQDVEAEDKLLGPFSFRQFIYLMIVGGAGFVGFFLFQISPFLVAIPLPVILLFGALALPLRKDQPMETYLLAIIRFIIKPKRRLWNPDGTINYVEITAPKVVEQQLTKNITQEAAEERLDYLARIMDSRGWSSKGVDKMAMSVSPAVAAEAQNTMDIMDSHADLAKAFDDKLAKQQEQTRQASLQRIQRAFHPENMQPQFATAADDQPAPRFNPYPTIHQKVVQPQGYKAPTPPPPPEEPKPKEPSPDIARLANNNDLSISAIAREAHRLQEGDEGEVVISLH